MLPRCSLSAPALGSACPAPAHRVDYTKTPVTSQSTQYSESSSPTTSLLLHMWGYDQTHAPPSSGRITDNPDLITGDAGAPQWLHVMSDITFFRKATGLVLGLAILACFVAILLTAASQFRTKEWVKEPAWDNWTEPVLSLIEERSSTPISRTVDDGKGRRAGLVAPTSTPGANSSFSGGNKTRTPAGTNHHGFSGRLVKPVSLPSRERLFRPQAQQPLQLRNVLHVPTPEKTGISASWRPGDHYTVRVNDQS